MPTKTVYEPAEIFLEHKDVTIYHVYRNNDVEDTIRDFWFSTVEDSDDEGGDFTFDVRELSTWTKQPERWLDLSEHNKTVIKAAIDKGELHSPTEAELWAAINK